MRRMRRMRRCIRLPRRAGEARLILKERVGEEEEEEEEETSLIKELERQRERARYREPWRPSVWRQARATGAAVRGQQQQQQQQQQPALRCGGCLLRGLPAPLPPGCPLAIRRARARPLVQSLTARAAQVPRRSKPVAPPGLSRHGPLATLLPAPTPPTLLSSVRPCFPSCWPASALLTLPSTHSPIVHARTAMAPLRACLFSAAAALPCRMLRWPGRARDDGRRQSWLGFGPGAALHGARFRPVYGFCENDMHMAPDGVSYRYRGLEVQKTDAVCVCVCVCACACACACARLCVVCVHGCVHLPLARAPPPPAPPTPSV